MNTNIIQNPDKQINGLSFLWLEITEQCNLACKHCYGEFGPQKPQLGKVSFHDWKRIIAEGQELGCRKIQFIGGEPTLHPNFRQLVEHARQCGYDHIEVYTNGTTLDAEDLLFLKENHVSIATSFYSDSDVTHDSITGRTGSYNKTVSFIDSTVKSGLPIRVGIVSMEDNSQRIEAAKSLLAKLGVQNVKVDKRRGIGRGTSQESSHDKDEELCGQCWKGNLCISASGDVFPCVFSRHHRLGNAYTSLRALVESQRTQDVRLGLSRKSQNMTPVNCDPYCAPYTQCDPCGPLN